MSNYLRFNSRYHLTNHKSPQIPSPTQQPPQLPPQLPPQQPPQLPPQLPPQNPLFRLDPTPQEKIQRHIPNPFIPPTSNLQKLSPIPKSQPQLKPKPKQQPQRFTPQPLPIPKRSTYDDYLSDPKRPGKPRIPNSSTAPSLYGQIEANKERLNFLRNKNMISEQRQQENIRAKLNKKIKERTDYAQSQRIISQTNHKLIEKRKNKDLLKLQERAKRIREERAKMAKKIRDEEEKARYARIAKMEFSSQRPPTAEKSIKRQ
jgi:hypothetical protein